MKKLTLFLHFMQTAFQVERSTDTDVLTILLGLAGKSEEINLILDYGSGNHRRYIGVSELAAVLEEEQPGLTEALIGLHALTARL